MNRPLHATLVSHTHWDRAWYVTFQEYRIRLVRLVDRLLELLQTRPDYRVYMLDGQMAVLEDYLEVRPQRVAELQEHCRQGRIQVGTLVRAGRRVSGQPRGTDPQPDGGASDGCGLRWRRQARLRAGWLRPHRATTPDIARFRHRQRLLLARPGRRG